MKKPCTYEGCTSKAFCGSGCCSRHGGGRRCQHDECDKGALGKTDFCVSHGGGRRCQHDGCDKGARGTTNFCRSHGGGHRCQYDGCTKSALTLTKFCCSHGGGRRCQHDGCDKGAQGNSNFCISHGGGRRCQYEKCNKSAAGPTDFCASHGGGRRCEHDGCDKSAQGTTYFCASHGGGYRCTSCALWSVHRKGNLCLVCRTGIGRIKQFEVETIEFLKTQPDLALFTSHDQSIPCCKGGRKFRPDILYSLSDRFVVLEIDEHEHKHQCTIAEFDRLHEIRDQLQTHGASKYMVVVRYNPNEAYRSVHDKHTRLAHELRDAFTTGDVVNAESGILRRYVGYTGQQKRKADGEYHERFDAELRLFKKNVM